MRYIILSMLLVTVPALAVDSEPALPNPALQQRYETLTHEFRCLVCQNETIAESNAGLAADLRAQVRQQLIAGKSNDQIKKYMVARYGDFVLFKPPWQPNTWLLWGGPLLLLGIGALVVLSVVRRKAQLVDSSPVEDAGEDPDA
jgi:cytochrome c-type biogenesis protein CcmH